LRTLSDPFLPDAAVDERAGCFWTDEFLVGFGGGESMSWTEEWELALLGGRSSSGEAATPMGDMEVSVPLLLGTRTNPASAV